MILIFSDCNDQSTNHVIDWLIYLNKKFIRINENDCISIVKIVLDKKKQFLFKVNANAKIYNLFTINNAWYRRGQFNLDIRPDPDLQRNMPHIHQDFNGIKTFFIEYLLEMTWHANFNHNINKLNVLRKAIDFGLNVPETICITDISDFPASKNKEYITKAIQKTQYFYNKPIYTECIRKKDLDGLNYREIYPSLIQEKINKFCDIRIFYLEGSYYPMAILSQNNPQTSLDFRRYDHVKPNRRIPIKLPTKTLNKLSELVRHFKLNSCSIDIVMDQSGKFWFLEINPVGQFSMVSKPCNYNLEKLLANALSKASH